MRVNRRQVPTREPAWESSVSNDRSKRQTQSHGLQTIRLNSAPLLHQVYSCACVSQESKRTSSSQSFWTAVQSPLRQNSIIQECKHLSCLLFTSVINLSLLFIFVYIYLLIVNVNALKTLPLRRVSKYLTSQEVPVRNQPIWLVQWLTHGSSYLEASCPPKHFTSEYIVLDIYKYYPYLR